MQTRRAANANHPRFEVAVSSKVEHGTYDMNDEEHTHHSSPNSAVQSESESTDLAMMEAMMAVEAVMPTDTLPVIVPISPNKFRTTGNTDYEKGQFGEKEEALKGSLTVSEDKSSNDNRDVSWSDSDGSTYISVSDQSNDSSGSNEHGNNENLNKAKAKLSETSKVSDESLVDVDHLKRIGVAVTTQKATVGPASDSKLQMTEKSKNLQLLENVDYYTGVDIASTNDGISVVKFITKEDTRDIFCRRLVPLEIPVRKRVLRDDVSEFSSEKAASVMPTGETLSVQAVYTRRGTTCEQQHKDMIKRTSGARLPKSKPHKNDGNFSRIVLTSQNFDIETGRCMFADQDPVSTFKKRDPGTNQESFTMVVDVPNYRNLDNLSSLGSNSATSKDDLEDIVCSLDDNAMESKAVMSVFGNKSPEVESTVDVNMHIKPNQRRSNQCDIADEDLSKRVESKGEPKMCDRIRVLRERIQKMKEKTDLEKMSDHPLRSDNSKESRSSKSKMEPLKSKRNLDTTLSSEHDIKEQRRKPAHVRARDLALEHSIQKQDLDFMKDTWPTVNKIGIVSMTETSKSSERQSSVPSEVSPALDVLDDVSTIHCDFEHDFESPPLIDLEQGFTHEGSSSRIKRRVVEYFLAGVSRASTCAHKANSSLETYASYRYLQAVVVGVWMKYIQGRSPTEKAMIGVMVVSFFSFLILLAAIFS